MDPTAVKGEPATPRVVSRLAAYRKRSLVFGIVIALGLVVHACFFLLVSVPVGEGPKAVEADPWIAWHGPTQRGTDPVVEERALLLDAEPLFVPTRWNAASDLDNIARLRDETELFPPFEPRLGEGRGIWSPRPPEERKDLLAERIADGQGVQPFRLLGLGETSPVASERPGRPPMVEIISLSTGRTLAEPLPLVTDGETPPDTLWNPLEFLVSVDPSTGCGLPLRLNSSGSPQWDLTVSRTLRRHGALRELPNGYFRIVVGP